MENSRFRCVLVREVKLPHRANKGDAGLDFYFPRNLKVSDLTSVEANAHLALVQNGPLHKGQFTASVTKDGYIIELFLAPETRILIPSGIRGLLEPKASMMQVNNKSGRASKQGLIFTAQVCDSPYTGEYHLGVYNSSGVTQNLKADNAVVQMVHVPVYLTEPEEVTLEEYESLSKGWGTRQEKGIGKSSNNK